MVADEERTCRICYVRPLLLVRFVGSAQTVRLCAVCDAAAGRSLDVVEVDA